MNYSIRPVEPGDARGINALRRMPGVFETILGTPAERISSTEEFIAGLDHNNYQFVAVSPLENGGEQVIGIAGLSIFSAPRLRHSAGLGILVHKDWQGQGVGSALMKAVLDMADNWLMLVRVELVVYLDNTRAIQLYKKYGFEEEGVKRMGSIQNGRYVDELVMSRLRCPPKS